MLYNVKAGILGLNPLGAHYASLIMDHVKNLNLIAAAGNTQKELLFAKNDLSLEYVYGDEKSLFDNHDIDAVFVFSEPRFRANHIIQAIDKGKHVFMLNPFALNMEDAEAVRQTAESHPSQVVMCASPVRSMQFLDRLIEINASGQLGDLQLIELEDNFIKSLAKHLNLPSGSAYLDTLTDEIQLCLNLDDRQADAIDIVKYKGFKKVQLKLQGKTMWNIIKRPPEDNLKAGLSIFYEKGKIEVSSDNQRQIRISRTDGGIELLNLDDAFEFNFPEYQQLHYFTQVILGKAKKDFTVAQSIQSMNLALAMEKADVLNASVDL